MNDFLPEDYEIPAAPSHFMEFKEGQNYFRALTPAIVGFQWWVENGQSRKPVRVRTIEEVPEEFRSEPRNGESARPFWAFAVYNYQERAVQVLVLKQQTIMRAIEAFAKSAKWGSPLNYDLVVEKTRTGRGVRDVEYSVIPEPKAPLDPGVVELTRQVPVRLEALFEGEDPFAGVDDPSAGAKAGRAKRPR
jgi:hypothetical protein